MSQTPNTALAIVPASFAEAQTMAETLAKSALLSDALRNKPNDVLFAILTGRELGLDPMASIRGIHVIQGRPTLSAETLVAVVLRSGLCEYFQQHDASDTSVTFETKRRHAPTPQRCTWTWEQAKRAALTGKDNWRCFPRQMLAARCKAELARLVYPDVVAGLYDPDEPPVAANSNVLDADWRDARDVIVPPLEIAAPSDKYASAYEAASDALGEQLDSVFQDYLVAVGTAPDMGTLDRIAGSSPGKPVKGSKEYDLATVAYRRRKALLLDQQIADRNP